MGTTVVIPQRNRGGARLWNCLNALRRQTVPVEEVIVSDLSSSPENLDNIRGICAGLHCSLLSIPWTGPFNRSLSINCAIRASASDNVLVMDVDCVAGPDCIETFERTVQPNTLVLMEHRRGREPQPDQDISSDWVVYYVAASANQWPRIAAGMFMGATKAFWTAIRGYDERFIGWGAEDDFVVWKARRAGSLVWVDWPRLVHQDHPDTDGKEQDRSRNAALFRRLTDAGDPPPARWGVRRGMRWLSRFHKEPALTVGDQPSFDVLALLPSAVPFVLAGAEYAALGLSRALAEVGYRVAMVTSCGEGGSQVVNGVPLYTGVRGWDERGVIDLVDQFRPKICISQYDSAWPVARARRHRQFQHVTYCHTHHSYDTFQSDDPAIDLWLFTSESLWEQSGRFGRHSVVFRPWLLQERWVSSTDRRRRRGWVRDRVTMINPSEHKGGDTVRYIARHCPDIPFLVSRCTYGSDVSDLREIPNVDVSDPRQELHEFYARSRVHLVPSRYESYGMAATEAALCGAAVVMSELPALREATFNRGTYVAAEDLDGWVRTVRAAYDNPRPTDIKKEYEARRIRDLQVLSGRLTSCAS